MGEASKYHTDSIQKFVSESWPFKFQKCTQKAIRVSKNQWAISCIRKEIRSRLNLSISIDLPFFYF